ncbi:MAG: 5-formyltetrahydrofolate cyclo-ligase [Solobacterium sp.]|nr:5-formyltetrahydrofolate cyclo-ligase [Solobacterium sp.]
MDKRAARQLGIKRRNALSAFQKKAYDQRIFSKVIQELSGAKAISIYVSKKEEVDTHRIIEYCFEKGIAVYVPRVKEASLELIRIDCFEALKEGTFGVFEPIGFETIDFKALDKIFVPVVAYDAMFHRVGYGKGYYDSILGQFENKIGLAYTCQEVESIEIDSWDITLDEMIHE